MTEVEAFLANKEMVNCTRMGAVISLEKCRENKRGERYRFYCETCNGGEVVARKEAKCVSCHKVKQIKAMDRCNQCYYEEIEKPRREESSGKVVGSKKKSVRICADCGKEKKIFSHDICSTCAYKKWGKGMKPLQVEPAVQEEEIGTASLIGPGTGTDEEIEALLEDEIISEEPLSGTPAQADMEKEVEADVAAPKKSRLDELLGAPSSLMMTLDFSDDADLYRRMIDVGIDADDVIGLLSMLLDNQLRRVA